MSGDGMTPGQRYYQKNRVAILARAKTKRAATPVTDEERKRRKIYTDDWKKRNPEWIRDYQLRWRYGLSLEQWRGMFLAQGSKCKICQTESPGKRDWATDHDHETGRVRGILCHRCNLLLGWLGENEETVTRRLQAIRDYFAPRAEEQYGPDGRLVPWEPKK